MLGSPNSASWDGHEGDSSDSVFQSIAKLRPAMRACMAVAVACQCPPTRLQLHHAAALKTQVECDLVGGSWEPAGGSMMLVFLLW